MTTLAWRALMRESFTSSAALLTHLELDPALLAPAQHAASDFSLRVPVGFVDRMKKGDPTDPLLRQILPIGEEMLVVPGFEWDPLQEAQKTPKPALLHKFLDRVLLIVTGACGVNCRFCFRRHFPYTDHASGAAHWDDVIDYIAARETIHEVILSGGDPLVVSDEKLSRLVTRLENIPHLKRLRIHTRMPIVLPERVDHELIAWLTKTRFRTSLVIHCNHPNEINLAVQSAMQKLSAIGVTLLNHTVLLKGVNDSVDTLVTLSESLFDCGVLPYYLFLLDKVAGAAHFEVPLAEAKILHEGLAARVSGYLLPKLAKEVPGAPAKVLL